MSSTAILVALIVLIFFSSSIESIAFNFPRFNSTETKIACEGDASIVSDFIQLNIDKLAWRVGRATFTDHVQLWDSTTQNLSDFTTHFSFTIDTLNSSVYSDGLTFFLAPADYQLPPNSHGGYLGLCNSSTYNSSGVPFVAIEFDTWVNKEWDPKFEHVGININSIASIVSVPWNASLHSRDLANAWVRYDARAKLLDVVLIYDDDDDDNHATSYNLSHHVDLMQVLPEKIKVGFTASTGIFAAKHIIHSWDFNSTLEMKEEEMKKKGKIIWPRVVVSLVIVVGGIGIVWGVMVVKWKIRFGLKKSREELEEERVNLTSMNGEFQRGARPMRFSYQELSAATSSFSDERMLGQGGFGKVYKGFLIDLDLVVAVKKISRGSKQGKKEYITEVKIIGQLRHRNLVQLIGWCHDGGEFLLVYEFMSNGSLDSHLFGKRKPPSWSVRYKIASGLATALLYLHEGWEQCVVHRDIKASNVMLDSSFNAKLGDFGLARLVDHELGGQTTALAGTIGYLAPECIIDGKVSKESDVYSFGIVVLEIACGRKSLDRDEEDESNIRLVEWVWKLHTCGRLLDAADKRLSMEYDVEQMECLLMVGLWCAQTDPNSRPSIRQAIRVLNHEEEMPALPNRMPIHVVYSNPTSITCTANDTGR